MATYCCSYRWLQGGLLGPYYADLYSWCTVRPYATGRNCGAMTKRCKYGVFTSYLELVVCTLTTLYCIVSSFENMYRGMYSQAKYIDSSPSRWIVPPLQPMQHNHSFNFGKPELELAISACQRARDKLCLTNPSSNGSLLLRDPVPQSLNK